ncbi:hypothetical protein FNV43_RR03093 [Rhamnella rubrinervis]|uniref:Vacuolar protein sorting-associated protein 62 n=1 Tax=Rhamnella rubrinervis TaxID=2594499 RepID=A0A8K0MP97_9ROSA|nr:hypothetical protein FNV43_RR03093 [Rhamnella rubrinervis]
MGNNTSNKSKAMPIETIFKLPSPLPSWPQAFITHGGGFAAGVIDLGGLQVRQVSTFSKVWATHEGGPDNLGATFYEPSSIPEGFHSLGFYSQPNNKPFFGWTLAAKNDDSSIEALKNPVDYSLVWNSESAKIKKDGNGYFWLPTPPEGYKATGIVVTTSPEKPPLDKIRCVRTEFTDQCEVDAWIWGPSKTNDGDGFNAYSLRPTIRGVQAMGVRAGTFFAQNGNGSASSMACLKNSNSNNTSSMPNQAQIKSIFQTYSPLIYLHPNEKYLPSSVTWYFTNGALLYHKGEESKPVPVDSTGSNLPQGGENDGTYWLDLPVDQAGKDRVKKGNLQSSEVYLHVKPMLGGTFTDIAIWVFYPFNGPSTAKVEIVDIPLGKIGEHIGDWEHLTLRVSNFNGELWRVYFSQHSGGTWVDASELEYDAGSNKVVSYSSLNGHAFYSKPGLVLQGSGGIGIRNDTKKSKLVVNTGLGYSLVSADYLGSGIIEPPWLNYLRKWGPKLDYDIAEEVKKVEKALPGRLKSAFEKFVNSLPNEIFGEEGPTGPKLKKNWSGDEV